MDELFLDVTDLIEEHINEVHKPHRLSGDSSSLNIDSDQKFIFTLPTKDAVDGENTFRYSLKEWIGCVICGDSATVVDSEEKDAWDRIKSIRSSDGQQSGHPDHHHPFPTDIDLRLCITSHLAAHIRKSIFQTLGFTCSAGISINKLLAKLGSGVKKPNSQTTLLPESRWAFMENVDVRKINGFGYATRRLLIAKYPQFVAEGLPLTTTMASSSAESKQEKYGHSLDGIDQDTDFHSADEDDEPEQMDTGLVAFDPQNDVRAYSLSLTAGTLRRTIALEALIELIGDKQGRHIYRLLQGDDDSEVVATGLPTQISIEDSFKHCTDLQTARAMLVKLSTLFLERMEEEEYTGNAGRGNAYGFPPLRFGTQASAGGKPRWRRYPRILRLTIRRRQRGNTRAWMDDRESSQPNTVDGKPSNPDSAQQLSSPTAPSFGKGSGMTYRPNTTTMQCQPELRGEPQFDLTLFNIAATDFRTEPPAGRSIASFFRKRPLESSSVVVNGQQEDSKSTPCQVPETQAQVPIISDNATKAEEVISPKATKPETEHGSGSVRPDPDHSTFSNLGIEDIEMFLQLPADVREEILRSKVRQDVAVEREIEASGNGALTLMIASKGSSSSSKPALVKKSGKASAAKGSTKRGAAKRGPLDRFWGMGNSGSSHGM
ncbi:hypothetical protein HK102_001459 [Quaeritorhiza haematococci]|nr:hypothetical protein HK102_001459 [Quaeritorhiza haematococci]